MNRSARVTRQPRRARPPIARTAAAVTATAVLALLAAACGSGSPSPAGSGGSPSAAGSASPSLVGFSHCMRSHGVPKFPDPGGSGIFPKGDPQVFGASTTQFSAARRACQHLLPNTINGGLAAGGGGRMRLLITLAGGGSGAAGM